jgi:hypothetical protein
MVGDSNASNFVSYLTLILDVDLDLPSAREPSPVKKVKPPAPEDGIASKSSPIFLRAH